MAKAAPRKKQSAAKSSRRQRPRTGSSKNALTFRHQDGDMTFRVKWGWFLVTPSNHITLSIMCEGDPRYSWMATPRFCLVDYPLDVPLATGAVIHFPGNGDELDADGPRAHVYVGVHQLPQDVEVRFKSVGKKACEVEISWAQPDVDYYDKRAKENRVVGQCTLKQGQRKDLWDPN